MYDRWLDDPAIGGYLTRFLSRERARVWLKDVPMKEYSRARNGIGPLPIWSGAGFPALDRSQGRSLATAGTR